MSRSFSLDAHLLFLGRNMGIEKMKSIGNGWKRAQIAKNRAWLNQAKTSYDFQQDAYMRDMAIRAMSPEAMKEKAEREAPLMRDRYAAEYAFTPAPTNGANWSTWQRIKRALVWGNI